MEEGVGDGGGRWGKGYAVGTVCNKENMRLREGIELGFI